MKDTAKPIKITLAYDETEYTFDFDTTIWFVNNLAVLPKFVPEKVIETKNRLYYNMSNIS